MRKKKVFVVGQPEIVDTVGGSITIFNNFCNLLTDNNFDVYGICYTPKKGFPSKLDNKVIFCNLYNENCTFDESFNNLVSDERPDLIVYFFAYLYVETNLRSEFNYIPRILMFHSRPDFYFRKSPKMKNKLKKIYKNTVSQILFESYIKLLPNFINKGNVICIPNASPITQNIINVNDEHKKIVYLSRIDNCKGLEFLINSFCLIANKYPDWSIDIYGQSQPEDYVNKLVKLTEELKVNKQINFKGITKDVLKTYLNYDFCVFPSYFEGFPVGLIEAQAVGLPSIGLNECTGVNELIINGYNGFLTEENYEKFAEKMELLIQDKSLRKNFSKNTLDNVKKYNQDKINKMWLDTVDTLINKKQLKDQNLLQNINKSIKCFSIEKIIYMQKGINKPSFLHSIFSVNSITLRGKRKKLIYLLGIKIVLSLD